jgi:hypothetical protein
VAADIDFVAAPEKFSNPYRTPEVLLIVGTGGVKEFEHV